MLIQPAEIFRSQVFFEKTIKITKTTLTWHRENRKAKVNPEELQVFLRIETKNGFFSNLFKFPLSTGENKSKYIKLTNYSSLKVQFTFKITNKQQQQQKKPQP